MALQKVYMVHKQGKDDYDWSYAVVYKQLKDIPNGYKYKEIMYDDEVWDLVWESGGVCSNPTGNLIEGLNEDELERDNYLNKQLFGIDKLLDNRNVSFSGLSNYEKLLSWSSSIKCFSKKEFPNLVTSEIYSMSCMFRFCSYLEYVDLSDFDLHSLECIDQAFNSCARLRYVNLSGLNLGKISCSAPFIVDEEPSTLLQLLVIENIRGNVKKIITNFVNNFITSRLFCQSEESFLKISYEDGLKELWSEGKFPEEGYIVVSPERVEEVSTIVKESIEYYLSEKFSCPEFPITPEFRSKYRNCIKVLSSDHINLNKIIKKVSSDRASKTNSGLHIHSEILNEIYSMLENGKSEKEIVKSLKDLDKGYSMNEIINALEYLDMSDNISDMFYSNAIQPLLDKYLVESSPEGIQSKYSIGDVAKKLYEKYPKGLVNEAIVRYLWNQYVV